MRGRLQGVFTVVVAGGPRLGDFVAGTVADVTSDSSAVAVGGCACIVGASIACLGQRRFLRYDAGAPQP